jgi:hypothetical protein
MVSAATGAVHGLEPLRRGALLLPPLDLGLAQVVSLRRRLREHGRPQAHPAGPTGSAAAAVAGRAVVPNLTGLQGLGALLPKNLTLRELSRGRKWA